MRYRIKFFRGEVLQRQTTAKFYDWNNAEFFLTRILRYKFNSELCTWIKGTERAEIVCANGIPF